MNAVTNSIYAYLKDSAELWGENVAVGEFEARQKRQQTGKNWFACSCCGKLVLDTKAIWVELNTDEKMFNQIDASANENLVGNDFGSMGVWPFGTTCGKNIPEQFRYDYINRKVGA